MAVHEELDISAPPGEPDRRAPAYDLARWSRPVGVFLAVLTLALAVSRYIDPELAVDFSAYLAAAQTFFSGENPYTTQLYDAPNFQGYIYIYPPGTLPFLWPLTWFSSQLNAALEVLLHLGAFAFGARYLWGYFRLKIPLTLCLALALLWHPFTISYRSGNLAIYMFAAFVACIWLAQRPRCRARDVLLAVLLGIGLIFKPMWGLAAGCVLLMRQRWASAAGLLGGALIVVGLSMLAWNGEVLLSDWWARVGEIRAKFRSPSLLEYYGPLLPAVALSWLAGAGALLRRHGQRNPDLWLWSCALLLIWPRISAYSYLILLPVLFYFWRRWGWQKALLLALPTLDPIYWLFADNQGIHAYHHMTYIWLLLVAGLLFVALWRFEDPRLRPQAPNLHDTHPGELP